MNLQLVFLGELHERSFQAGSELWLLTAIHTSAKSK
jgi:hypothetical protein